MSDQSKPLVRLPHTVTVGTGAIRLYDHRPLAFMRAMDSLFPSFVSRSEDRTGPCYVAFDDNGFIGYCTSKALGKKRCAGSTRKNPWHTGDRWAMLRLMLAVNFMGGSETRPSYTMKENYAVLKLWKLMGLGCELMPDGKRWRATGNSPEAVARLDAAIEVARMPYRDARLYAAKRMKTLNPSDFLPREEDMAPGTLHHVWADIPSLGGA